jgi:hypothetical protein
MLRECDLKDWLLREVMEELATRDDTSPGPASPPPAQPAVDWEALVRTWHREMALRFHPDRGGSIEAMAAVNIAAERLRELVGV